MARRLVQPAALELVRHRYLSSLHRAHALAAAHAVLLRRLRIAALVGALTVAGWFALEAMRQWLANANQPLSFDFSLYRASAIQGTQFGWNHLYDLSAQRHVYDEQVRSNPTLGHMLWAPNVYPPPASWLALPFTLLSIPTGYAVWSGLILAATLFSFLTLAPGNVLEKALQTTLALCPFIVLWSLIEGQVTSFQMAAVAGTWLLIKHHKDSWAGIVLIPLVLKPQTVVLVPLALLAAGRLRMFRAWAAGSVLVALAVVVNIGFDGTMAFLQRLQFATANPTEYLLGPVYTLVLHFQSRTGRLGAQILIAALTLIVAWRHRRSGPEVPIGVGLVGSLLVASYLHINDMITLFPAAWLILRAYPRWWMWLLMAGGYVVMLLNTGPGVNRWGEVLVLFEVSLVVLLALLPVSSPRAKPTAEPELAQPAETAELALEPVGV